MISKRVALLFGQMLGEDLRAHPEITIRHPVEVTTFAVDMGGQAVGCKAAVLRERFCFSDDLPRGRFARCAADECQ